MTERLSDHARAALVAYARGVLTAHVLGGEAPRPPDVEELYGVGSVFVTLRRRDGELRGCIGDTGFQRDLREVVASMTRAAASEDPRFPALSPEELADVLLEISRLTPPFRGTVEDIEIGRHGVVVRQSGRRGLLLPQVAPEFGCDARGFVELACRKAGLPPEHAARPDLEIHLFEAEVFGE